MNRGPSLPTVSASDENQREYLILAIHVAKANAATQQWKATREDRESVKRQQTAMRRKRQPLVDLQEYVAVWRLMCTQRLG